MRRRLPAFFATLLLALAFWSGGGWQPGGSFLAPPMAVAQAQQPALTEADYEDWEKVAERAAEALDSAAASNAAFEELREDLTGWRSRFQAAVGRDTDRIKILEEQIAALGEPPGEGETESEQLSSRRATLNEEYQALITPAREAEEAATRANGLIQRLDRLIRSREREELLERRPSPIYLRNIVEATENLVGIGRILAAEVSSAARLPSDRTRLTDNLPAILVLMAFALVVLIRGREWFRQLVEWTIRRRPGSDRAIVAAMLVSFGQVVLPTLGLVALATAMIASSMFGPNGEALLSVMVVMGFCFFGARWLGSQTFPAHDDWPVTLDLSRKERLRGRFYASSLGILFAVAALADRMVRLFPMKPETIPVLAFPILVLAAICLAGIGRLLVSHGEKHATDADEHPVTGDEIDEKSFLDRIIFLTGRACPIFAVIGTLAITVGYVRLSVFLILSPVLTLALVAAVGFLQRLSMYAFRMFAGSSESSKGLLPVLISFLLILAALPFLAVIWGMRWADLGELWNRIQAGVTLGDVRISPSAVLVLVSVFAIGLLITRLVQAAMRASVLPRTRIDPGGQKAVISGLGYLGVFVSAVAAMTMTGLDLSSLAIVAGALSVGVGFGLQNIVSNFVAGLILLIERPVTEGDWIEVGGVMGTVRKISVRATTVETFDRTDVVVPNSDFVSGQVTNWTRGNLSGRLILPVGVAYGTDTRKVEAILQEIAEAHPLVIVNPPPLIVFQGFGADSLDFEMRVILRDINFGLGTRTELNHQIAERFAEEGIEIPFAQRDIWLRNPESLHPRSPNARQGKMSPAPIGPPRPDPEIDLDGGLADPSEDDS